MNGKSLFGDAGIRPFAALFVVLVFQCSSNVVWKRLLSEECGSHYLLKNLEIGVSKTAQAC